MTYTGGMMEFEFDEATGSFQPTGKIVTYIKNAVMNGDFDTAVQFYASAQGNVGDKLMEDARTGSQMLRDALAKMFEMSRDFARASELYMLSGKLDKAATLAEHSYDFERAAKLYEQSGRFDKAAEAYERDLDFEKAAAMFMKIKDYERAAQNLEKAGLYMKAGDLFAKLHKMRDAARAYQQVAPTDPDFIDAMMKLGEILYRMGQLQYAMKTYHAIASKYPCNEKTAIAYARLADGYEQAGQAEVAAKLRKKVEAVNPALLTPTRDAHKAIESNPTSDAVLDAEPAHEEQKEMTSFRAGFQHVHSFPLFERLSLDDVQKFYDLCAQVKLEDGAILINEGESQPYMFIILKGNVEILKRGIDGSSTVVATLKPGQAVGELSVITGAETTATVMASGEVIALRIHRDDFLRFLREDPRRAITVYESVISVLSSRLNDVNRKLAAIK